MGFSPHSSVTGSVLLGWVARSSNGISRGVETAPPSDSFHPAEETDGAGKCSRTKNNSNGVFPSSRREKSKLLVSAFSGGFCCAARPRANTEANNMRRVSAGCPPSPSHLKSHLEDAWITVGTYYL